MHQADNTAAQDIPAALMEALGSSGIALALYDINNRLSYCNDNYLRFSFPHTGKENCLGMRHDEILEAAFSNLLQRQVVVDTDRDVWIRGELKHFSQADGIPCTVAMADGSWEQVVYKHTPDGGTLVLRVDITALKKTEQEAQAQAALAKKLSLVAERTDNAVVITDAQGLIEWVNEGFTRMTQYSLAEAVGRKPGSLLQGPASDPAVVNLMADAVRSGEGFKIELINYRKSGQNYWAAIEAQPVHDEKGRLIHFVAIESDITARRELENVLRLAHERAEQASRLKSDFLANISHEIRTPMNGVLGMLDMALRAGLKPAERKYIELAHNSAQSLLSVINNILDFSRLDAGKLEIDEADFSLSRLLADIVRSHIFQAHKKGLDILLSLPPELPDHVCSDPVRLRQIMNNLLSNAIKFTERGSIEVSLSHQWMAEALAEMTIRILDTGIGIEADKQKIIFEPFMQADASTTRKYGGTGLGLSIVTRLVECMNGRVELGSIPGKGSIFTVTVPMATLPANSTEIDNRHRLKGRRILVVDHTEKRRMMMQHWLEACQAQVQNAVQVETAITMLESAYLSEQPYDAVIINAGITETSCFSLLEMIRLMPVPTAALTLIDADARLESMEQAARNLGSAVLVKPVIHNELFQTLASLIEQEPRMQSPSSPLPGASSFPGSETALKRVLLVEDNPVNRMVAETMLAQFSVEVHTAENGLEALELYDQWPYDLILMDLQMPVMDGLEATQHIRKQETRTGKRTPIVALTANAMEGDRERCLQSGIDGYLAKPVTLEELEEEMMRVLHINS
jgi:two-component system sensor histidine kinase/response regulator